MHRIKHISNNTHCNIASNSNNYIYIYLYKKKKINKLIETSIWSLAQEEEVEGSVEVAMNESDYGAGRKE